MPYTHRKEGDKNCVYKKEDGSKVGCTKGSVHKYLAALHANANENTDLTENENKNKLVGGLADKLTPKDIADKFNISLAQIEAQIKRGMKAEKEHTSNEEEQREIAMDHLTENPNYYDYLDKMEKNIDISENTKSLIKRLIRENLTKL